MKEFKDPESYILMILLKVDISDGFTTIAFAMIFWDTKGSHLKFDAQLK